MQRSAEPTQTAAMEEWVLLGESGSDADSVQFIDLSASDKDDEVSFTTVQMGGNNRAADALDSSAEDLVSYEELQESHIGGENEDEEGESNGADGYFDLNLPALTGSKAVFGAYGDCFDANLAASILSMGNVGSDTGMIHCADDDDTDIESSDADMEQPESYSCGRRLDGIDLESICAVDDDDAENSDAEESDYSDDGTESSDTEESYYSDEGTEFFDASGTTCSGDDTTNSDFIITPQRSLAAGASTAALRPPTAPHLFFPNRAGSSIAASLPPSAPHLYFRHRAGASTFIFRKRTVTY